METLTRFDIRFYLVSILFIIFDLEVTFLFPWAISLNKIGLFGFWSMIKSTCCSAKLKVSNLCGSKASQLKIIIIWGHILNCTYMKV